MRKLHKYIRRFVNHIRKTYKNKLLALAMLVLGALTIPLENDLTAFILIAMFAIPAFFAKENWVLTGKRGS